MKSMVCALSRLYKIFHKRVADISELCLKIYNKLKSRFVFRTYLSTV